MHQHSLTPPVALKVAVVGGGITGLAAAYGLQKAGHDVLVLDETDGGELCAGSVPSPPNMTRTLTEMGLKDYCEPIFESLNRVDFLNANNGGTIGAMTNAIFDVVTKDSMVDFGTFECQGLHDVLRRVSQDLGVQIRHHTKVIDVEEGAPPTVVLEDGEELDVDLVIVADGSSNALWSYKMGYQMHETNVKSVMLRASVPTARLAEHSDLRPLIHPQEWSCWLGAGVACRLHTAPGNKERCDIVFSYTVTSNVPGLGDRWRPVKDPGALGLDLSTLEPRLRKLLLLCGPLSGRTFSNLPAAETLVSISRRIVLVGEAAHCLSPGGHYDGAMGFEDASVLNFIFSKIQARDQIPRLLCAYDEIRQPRAAGVHEYEQHHQKIQKASPGPIQAGRDAAFKKFAQFEHGAPLDEDVVQNAWGKELAVATYDARSGAEGWWNQYGSSIVNREHRNSVFGNIKVSVQRKKESQRYPYNP